MSSDGKKTWIVVVEKAHLLPGKAYICPMGDIIEKAQNEDNYGYSIYTKEQNPWTADGKTFETDTPEEFLQLIAGHPVVIGVWDTNEELFYLPEDSALPDKFDWAWEVVTHDLSRADYEEFDPTDDESLLEAVKAIWGRFNWSHSNIRRDLRRIVKVPLAKKAPKLKDLIVSDAAEEIDAYSYGNRVISEAVFGEFRLVMDEDEALYFVTADGAGVQVMGNIFWKDVLEGNVPGYTHLGKPDAVRYHDSRVLDVE